MTFREFLGPSRNIRELSGTSKISGTFREPSGLSRIFLELPEPSWNFRDLLGPSGIFHDLSGPSRNSRDLKTYIKNNSGPSTVPCGRPLLTSAKEDDVPSTKTVCFRSSRKLRIHAMSLPLSPFGPCGQSLSRYRSQTFIMRRFPCPPAKLLLYRGLSHNVM